ncbi:hypothetical protein TCAL_16584 [Tigriopus californicus]|uniref:Uncharacterized protein n=1 Tax=Tigriopus californicus TaxID=6832 RepID=A0A553NDV0_TIGCA|nr:hypothetical protein TCAL_16584 [Tigriopus californicus]
MDYSPSTGLAFCPVWSLPDGSTSIGQPSGDHESVVQEVPVDSVKGSVFIQVHLDQIPLMQQETIGHIRHVTAAFHLIQKVIQLPTAFFKVISSGQ